jgi:hypothetical protein
MTGKQAWPDQLHTSGKKRAAPVESTCISIPEQRYKLQYTYHHCPLCDEQY